AGDFRVLGLAAKRSLAAQLGTTPETLSRSLAKFRAAGMIRVKGAQVTILDADALGRAVHSGE
ncbi:MAG TPA: helix-turn-helix domain-containing protein, partial [Phycisphaerae bacterium]|nr:helix-turn-helix domain-containing protein [Phycisphaerae bacterium]